MGELKDVLIEVNAELWQAVRIQALKESLTIREWVAKAFSDYLAKSDNK